MSRAKADNGVVLKLFLTAQEAMEFTGTSEGCGWNEIKQDQIEQGWQGRSNGKSEQYFLPYLIISTLKKNFLYGKQTADLVSSFFDNIGSVLHNHANLVHAGQRNTRGYYNGRRGSGIRRDTGIRAEEL